MTKLDLAAGTADREKVRKPLIIGHRGACGYRPEHTLASYELAIEQGADYVEPDLVSTKDGILVCRHENEIASTTDVAEKFPGRKTQKKIDGEEIEGWFVEDFSLAELKTLRAKERLPFRSQQYNGLYEIPTFEEMIALVKQKSREKGRVIGIYPETKHPTYHASVGLSLEEPLMEILRRNGYDSPDAPVFIQSFEVENLKKLRKITKIRLLQLLGDPQTQPGCALAKGDKLTYGDMMKPEGLREIAQYAYGIGPWKEFLLPTKNKKLTQPTSLLKDAHAVGLKVHIYTLRNEARYLAEDYQGDPYQEYYCWFRLGVDGMFTDFPDTAVRAREIFYQENVKK